MNQKKILLVDDSNTVIMLERMILSKGPYDLVVARDGKEGVEMASAQRPDLILMDVMMPHMNGIEAVKKLRSQSHTARIPVIMVTTRGEEESVKSGYQAGCSDYVTKPIDAKGLLSKVRGYLGQ